MDDAGNQIGTAASVKNGADAENLSIDDRTRDKTTLRDIQETVEITVEGNKKSGKTDGRIEEEIDVTSVHKETKTESSADSKDRKGIDFSIKDNNDETKADENKLKELRDDIKKQKQRDIDEQPKKCFGSEEQNGTGKTEDDFEGWRNIICFFCLGIVTFLHKETSLTAAQDILTGSAIPTSTFLIVSNVPLMAVKVTLPWFMERIPYPIRIATAAVILSLAYLLVGLGTSVTPRLLGVAFGSTMHPVAEVTILSLTPHFSRVTMLAFSSGLGVSSFLASGLYTGLTVWTCVSPQMVILIMSPWPLLLIPLSSMLEKGPLTKGEYQLLPEEGDHKETGGLKYISSPLPMHEKKQVVSQTWHLTVSIIVNYFCQYLVMKSIITTRAFEGSHILPRDHFQWYSLAYRGSKFLGRSYLALFMFCPNSGLQERLRTDMVEIFAILGLLQLLVFLLDSLLHFIPNIETLVFLCFLQGFCSGAIYSNAGYAVFRLLGDQPKQNIEFALGLVVSGTSVGVLAAGFAGLIVEPYIKTHCLHVLQLGEYCFTRPENESSWAHNIHCH